MTMKRRGSVDQGSIELVVLGLVAALIVVLAIPLIGALVSDEESEGRKGSESTSASQIDQSIQVVK